MSLVVKVERAKRYQTRVFDGHKRVVVRYRSVSIPDDKVGDPSNVENILDLTFLYGQNETQPQTVPSVSVEDIIHYGGKRYRVENLGYQELRVIGGEESVKSA